MKKLFLFILMVLILNSPLERGQVCVANAGVSISAGANHSILLKDGVIWTWGTYDLGGGRQFQNLAPIKLEEINDANSIASGHSHGMALQSGGTVMAWGKNTSGQLGDGIIIGRETPMPVLNLTNITAISAGYYHSIALQNNGQAVWIWGSNIDSQLGNTTYAQYSSLPLQQTGVTDVADVSAGYGHSITVKNGEIWAWGYNLYGQIGDGTTANKLTPINVKADASSNFNNVKAISAGKSHSVSLKNDDTVWTWGYNAKGQLGDNSTTQRLYPVQSSGLNSVTAVSAGSNHTLALKNDKTVWVWGDNTYGQLGDAPAVQHKTPWQIPNFNNVIAIAAGGNHSLAVKEDGTVWAWGDNSYGQLGQKTNISYSSVPIQVIAPGDINADWSIDLADTILALKVLSGISVSVNLSCDVNSDNKIGLAEVIYILQKEAGLR